MSRFDERFARITGQPRESGRVPQSDEAELGFFASIGLRMLNAVGIAVEPDAVSERSAKTPDRRE